MTRITTFIFLFCININIARASSRTEVVLSPTVYRITSTTGNQSFSVPFERTQSQLASNYQYSLNIKNADGEEHVVMAAKDCNQLGHLDKMVCIAQRSANLFYVNNIRIRDASILLNNIEIANKYTFNKEIAQLTVPVGNLVLQNNLQLNLKGSFGSYVEVSLSVIISNIDELAPAVSSSVSPDTLTKNPTFHVSIADSSNTETEVYKDGALIQTTPSKYFDVSLTEGLNNFVIKSKDENNNIAPDFILQNITLDTVAPVINSNTKIKYFLNALPGVISLEFYPSESLSSLILNGSPLMFDATVGFYKTSIPITQPDPLNFEIKAIDRAGNETLQSFSSEALIDNTPPVISLGSTPIVIITDSYLLSVSVADENATLTTIAVDGTATSPTNEKDFSYLIEFPQDGTKTIVVSTTDEAQNVTQKTIKITKNTAPFVAQVSSPLNNTTLNSHTFDVEIVGSKPIQEAVFNGITYTGSNALSIKMPIHLINDGNFNLTVQVKDVFGVTTNASVQIQVSTNSLSSWNYQECSVEQ